MQVVIKKPKIGQYLVDGKVKVEVKEVWGFYQCMQIDRKSERDQIYAQLKEDLGNNYRELYYQIYGRVLRGKPEGHTRWQHIVLDWKQVQNYTLV